MYREELNDLSTLQPHLTGSVLMTTCASLSEQGNVFFPTSYTPHVFGEHQLEILKEVMMKLGVISSDQECQLNSTYYKYRHVTIDNIKLPSSTTKSLSIAMAKWDEDLFGSSPTVLPRLFVNPCSSSS